MILFLAGRVKSIFSPVAKTYSFKQIRNMEYDKKDKVLMMAEETGPIITGAAAIGIFISFLVWLL